MAGSPSSYDRLFARVSTQYRELIPANDSWVLAAGGLPVATIRFDTSARPDLADLLREFDLEGPADTQNGFDFGMSEGLWYAVLEISVQRPIENVIRTLLSRTHNLALLEAIAESGEVSFTADPVEGQDGEILPVRNITFSIPTQRLKLWLLTPFLGR